MGADPTWLNNLWVQLKDAHKAFIAFVMGIALIWFSPTEGKWLGYVLSLGALASLLIYLSKCFKAWHTEYNWRVTFSKLTPIDHSLMYEVLCKHRYKIDFDESTGTSPVAQSLTKLQKLGFLYTTDRMGHEEYLQYQMDGKIESLYRKYSEFNARKEIKRLK